MLWWYKRNCVVKQLTIRRYCWTRKAGMLQFLSHFWVFFTYSCHKYFLFQFILHNQSLCYTYITSCKEVAANVSIQFRVFKIFYTLLVFSYWVLLFWKLLDWTCNSSYNNKWLEASTKRVEQSDSDFVPTTETEELNLTFANITCPTNENVYLVFEEKRFLSIVWHVRILLHRLIKNVSREQKSYIPWLACLVVIQDRIRNLKSVGLEVWLLNLAPCYF